MVQNLTVPVHIERRVSLSVLSYSKTPTHTVTPLPLFGCVCVCDNRTAANDPEISPIRGDNRDQVAFLRLLNGSAFRKLLQMTAKNKGLLQESLPDDGTFAPRVHRSCVGKVHKRRLRIGARLNILEREERSLSLIILYCTKREAHTPPDPSGSPGDCVCDLCRNAHGDGDGGERAGMFDSDSKYPLFIDNARVQVSVILRTRANTKGQVPLPGVPGRGET